MRSYLFALLALTGCGVMHDNVTDPPVCGDGDRATSEACDDGNTNSGDGCSATCSIESPNPIVTCGNGRVETGEACDDGNTLSGDGCSSTCAIESTVTGHVLFSEYVEGLSYDKAIEIANDTASPFDLEQEDCWLHVYANGAATPSMSMPLVGMVAPGDVFVVCHPQASAAILAECDASSSGITFNGNDALELECADELLDVIGQIGFDPGMAWRGPNNVSTADATLVRSCAVTQGDTNGADAFDGAGWVGLTTFGLGEYDCAN